VWINSSWCLFKLFEMWYFIFCNNNNNNSLKLSVLLANFCNEERKGYWILRSNSKFSLILTCGHLWFVGISIFVPKQGLCTVSDLLEHFGDRIALQAWCYYFGDVTPPQRPLSCCLDRVHWKFGGWEEGVMERSSHPPPRAFPLLREVTSQVAWYLL